MKRLTKETEAILLQRFGKDSIIALATSIDNTPYVRNVDSFYADGAFYVLTYGLSGKMQQIAKNPKVAVCGDWFTAHGIGENLGHILLAENAALADQLRAAFTAWYSNGHINESDENTIILRIRLTDGLLFHHGTKYDIDFT